ncbi:diacylglycerol kinase family protein [Sporosarcina sp. P33]|uniref:diacylglycerol/lipid kinase family protein n=1 Tax=Sporosarcina sp. P33 TaxID=1930764 RepID=UPI0009C15894|nr:diacylglycerol kinase family protein [Sporosarcina sp. P33]ARD47086.1 hypothetical protein SporoP33_01715 [Sporosarcina sp. P33]
MDVHFIINEQAGDGKGAKVWAELKKENVYPFDLTEYRGHATELAFQLAKKSDEALLLVVIGGDGTIHEVLNGVAGFAHVTIGVMKAGSGNDFVREFPAFSRLDDIQNYAAAKSPKRKAVDFGSVQLEDGHKRYFAGSSGFGLDADISLAVSRSPVKHLLNRWKLGSVVYALTVVHSLLTFTRFSAAVQIGPDTRHFKKVWMITVSNQKYYGGGMKISPHSVYDDGEFELTVVHSISLIKFLAVFLTVFNGSHTRFRGVSVYKARKFIIKADRKIGCHTDGEFIGTTAELPVICEADVRQWYVADNSHK